MWKCHDGFCSHFPQNKSQRVFLPTVVAAPTATKPQCSGLRRGFQCAAARLQDEAKSDKPPSSSSTTYHEHYQAHSAKEDTAAASQEDSASDPAAEEASRPNTRSANTKVHSTDLRCFLSTKIQYEKPYTAQQYTQQRQMCVCACTCLSAAAYECLLYNVMMDGIK